MWLGVLVAAATCIALTPISVLLASRLGALDQPGAVKIHSRVMPRLGGLAIFVSSVVGLLVSLRSEGQLGVSAVPLMVGSTVIAGVGMTDDLFSIRPIAKIFGGLAAAAAYSAAKFAIGDTRFGELAAAMVAVSVLTIGLSNSFNLLDGMDGLLAGITAIVAIGGCILSAQLGALMWRAAFASCFASCAAFLLFNFPPARTFMGDSGSLCLGYWIAVGVYETSFSGLMPTRASWSLLLMLGVPVSDSVFAVVRRLRSGQGLFAGDRRHIYDRLHAVSGQSTVKTILMMYLLTAVCVGVGLCTTMWGSNAMLVGAVIALYGSLLIVGLALGAVSPK